MVVGRDLDAGLQWSLAYGQCNRHVYLNASPYQSDVNENDTFDPKILEEQETNVVEDENTKKFEILQQLEDDYEEEKEI